MKSITFLAVGMAILTPRLPAAEPSTPEQVSYYKDIRPIFQASCHGCHQPAKAKGKYVMTSFERLLGGGDSELKAVVPKDPDQSHLLELITPKDGQAEMPQKGPPLPPAQIALIRQWIEQGATDDTPANARQRYDMFNPPVYSRPPVITSLDVSPDGQLLAVAGFHEVLLWRADGSALVARLVGLSERIESVRFSPDGKSLAVTGGLPARMGEVQVWDVEKRELKLSVPVTFDTLYGASWSPDGQLIAFGCADKTVRAIRAGTGEQILYQGSHADWVFDTSWSTNGDHIVSVGRDMTAKLTELATQRFIDNLTSITPGALKGGLAAVATHPLRDEILVGGADGIPQIYRLFRKTKRVIGDNANLIRRFAPMPGRIFSVDFSPDGKHIVAGSSLDGRGTIQIYGSDYDSTLSEEMIKLLTKLPEQRNAEENKKVETYHTQDISLLASIRVEAGVYAVTFTPDGAYVIAAGADGVVRLLDGRTGGLRRAFVPVPLPDTFRETVVALSLENTPVELRDKYEYVQLVATGWFPSGETIDVTRQAQYQAPSDVVQISSAGRVTPLKDGTGELVATFAGRKARLPVTVSNSGATFDPDYIRDVMPVVSKLGCNAGTCHGALDGRNGFKLSLRGYDPIYDVRAFTDDLAARRINLASPDDSLMLLKATGAVPHEGGQRMKPDQPYYHILRDWIADGCQLNLDTPRVTSIELLPSNPVVQKLDAQQQVRVIATYADSKRRDVTAEAFVESGNIEIATADNTGLISALRRGEAPLLARFEGAYAVTTLTVMGERPDFVWTDPPTWNRIDEFVAAKWQRMKILPSALTSDAEFLRRVHLDLTGLPPTADQVRAFLADSRETRLKREEIIDQLVGSDNYVDHWANKWGDLLQVNSKFLGSEGAAAFNTWIRDQVKTNAPYNQFVRSILTATGSNKDNPPASYYKILREPTEIMENTTHLFLGTRFNCNKCHDHPFERWTQDQYYETAAFFARTALKKDPASGDKRIGGTAVEGSKPLYEAVYDADQGEVIHDRTGQVAPAAFPFAAKFEATDTASRRERLAAWMVSPDNPYFARSYVNRLWGYLTGVGLIEPLDDIRAGNPPSNPQLLDWLTQQFIESGFDVRHMIRAICKSRTYQLSIASNAWNQDDHINFSHATPRRLPAEVLFDAIYGSTGSKSKFPGLPEGTRAAALPDAGIKLPDGFLGNLGRPSRESACECERSNDIQLGPIMAMITGPTVDQAITDPQNAIAKLVETEPQDQKLIEELYLRILNRPATDDETERLLRLLTTIETDHQELLAQLDSYKQELAPVLDQRETQRQKDIADSKAELAAYKEEIAPRETELERKREEGIVAAEKTLSDYDNTLAERLAKWETDRDRKTIWTLLDPQKLDSSMSAKLERQPDSSIFVTEKNDKGTYTIVVETTLENIAAFKLEALADERLPGGGPGRADDGNFVVTEFTVTAAPKADPDKTKPVPLTNAKATFSQGGYAVETAIDGKNPDDANGWALAPKVGRVQEATFELKKKLGSADGVILTFAIEQNYRTKKHSLGRFRLSASTASDIDFGLPQPLAQIIDVPADQRSEEQHQTLVDFYRSVDQEFYKRKDALTEAKKPRPIDPNLTALEQKVARVEAPLPPDPKLTDLERAANLSGDQLQRRRLTTAQDLAWALINSPAFLFNR